MFSLSSLLCSPLHYLFSFPFFIPNRIFLFVSYSKLLVLPSLYFLFLNLFLLFFYLFISLKCSFRIRSFSRILRLFFSFLSFACEIEYFFLFLALNSSTLAFFVFFFLLFLLDLFSSSFQPKSNISLFLYSNLSSWYFPLSHIYFSFSLFLRTVYSSFSFSLSL